MSDNERMDRAKRIRQMREGDREDDQTAEADADPDDTAADDPPEATGVDDPETPSEGTDPEADAAGSTETDGGATAESPTDVTPDGEISAPLPDAETLDSATTDEADDDDEESAPTTAPAGVGAEAQAGTESTTEEETRVLEFTLDDERYCLEIEYIEEIVKKETVTRVPNTPAFVEGVVDLRGQITTIVDPKEPLEKDGDAGELIVVFDADAFEDEAGNVGWAVDDVRQVAPVTDDQVNDAPTDHDHIEGVIDRGVGDEEADGDDGEFVIWTTPDLIFEEATETGAAG